MPNKIIYLSDFKKMNGMKIYKVFSNCLIITIGTLLVISTVAVSIPELAKFFESKLMYLHNILIFATYIIWIWSWLTGAYGNPGYTKTDLQERGIYLDVMRGDIPKNLQHLKICKKCGLPMPKGSVHCEDCDMCVLRQDHHCGVIVNCVADRNFKAFVLGFFYAGVISLECGIYSIIACHYESKTSQFGVVPLITGVYGLIIALMMFAFTGIFLGTNYNESPIKELTLKDFVSSFGDNVFMYFIPIQSKSTKLAWPDVEWEIDEPLQLL